MSQGLNGKREKLVKLLQMTLSDNDAEALAAIRRANAILRGAGLNWTELFACLELKRPNEPAIASQPNYGSHMSEMFERAMRSRPVRATWTPTDGGPNMTFNVRSAR